MSDEPGPYLAALIKPRAKNEKPVELTEEMMWACYDRRMKELGQEKLDEFLDEYNLRKELEID
jgi:hypothetical protein